MSMDKITDTSKNSKAAIGLNQSGKPVLPTNDNSNPQQGTGKPLLPMFLNRGATSPLTEETLSQEPTQVTSGTSIDAEKRPINHVKIPATQHDSRKLFVGGLPTNVSEYSFLKFFEQFGEVIDSVVMIDRQTKRSRGFGFVTFASEDVARSLLTAIPGRTGMVTIMGKVCEVKASEPKTEVSSAHGSRGWDQRRSGAGQANAPKHFNHRGDKSFPSDYGRDDGRNFDDIWNGQVNMHMTAHEYARNNLTAPPLYHQAVHSLQAHGGPLSSYPYPGSAWEASYPGPNGGGDFSYGPAIPGVGMVDHVPYYSHPNQYHVNNSMYAPMGGVHPHYANYYAAQAPIGMPLQAAYAADGNVEPHPHPYHVPHDAYDQNAQINYESAGYEMHQ